MKRLSEEELHKIEMRIVVSNIPDNLVINRTQEAIAQSQLEADQQVLKALFEDMTSMFGLEEGLSRWMRVNKHPAFVDWQELKKKYLGE